MADDPRERGLEPVEQLNRSVTDRESTRGVAS